MHSEKRTDLLAMGFSFGRQYSRRGRAGLRWERVKAALLQYNQLHGNMRVPQPYEIPYGREGDEQGWEEDLQGVALGMYSILYSMLYIV